MAGVIQGLSVLWHLTDLKGKNRSIADDRDEVKLSVSSSTVGFQRLPNQLTSEIQRPKASWFDRA